MRKKPASAIPTIIMAAFALLIILVLMHQVRRNLSLSSLSALGDGKIAFIDSTYYNALYKFQVKLPNERWRCTRLADTVKVPPADTASALWPQIHWLVAFDRVEKDTIARSRIGLLVWPGSVPDYDLSVALLAEKYIEQEKAGRRIPILQPVTSPAHHAFSGSYFVIILPQQPVEQNQVLFCCILPRRNWAYIIKTESPEAHYDFIRPELERLVKNFQSYAITG
ncbi:hypothetical protein JXO59_16840 [candidate division KSB1 bacterium]|nr:hypothetical protein [candidate division KSB1 bacterium]